jgi:tRNA(fMet)-specific endonuclease VapC
MNFLLDTNAVIEFLNKPDGKVTANVLRHRSDAIVTSSIVIHELFLGIFKSTRPARNLAVLEALSFKALSFDREDARQAGRIRAQLEQEGRPIGPYDTLIAGQALRHGLTLITANTREFERVPGLALENWSV